MTGVAIAVAGVAAAIVLFTVALLVLAYRRRGDIRFTDVSDEHRQQYTVATPAGPAVLTKVYDQRGVAFEIETNFRGEGVRLYYVAPAMAVAKRRIESLVAERLSEARR